MAQRAMIELSHENIEMIARAMCEQIGLDPDLAVMRNEHEFLRWGQVSHFPPDYPVPDRIVAGRTWMLFHRHAQLAIAANNALRDLPVLVSIPNQG